MSVGHFVGDCRSLSYSYDFHSFTLLKSFEVLSFLTQSETSSKYSLADNRG